MHAQTSVGISRATGNNAGHSRFVSESVAMTDDPARYSSANLLPTAAENHSRTYRSFKRLPRIAPGHPAAPNGSRKLLPDVREHQTGAENHSRTCGSCKRLPNIASGRPAAPNGGRESLPHVRELQTAAENSVPGTCFVVMPSGKAFYTTSHLINPRDSGGAVETPRPTTRWGHALPTTSVGRAVPARRSLANHQPNPTR
jgi:hypothetical protein